jgi:hypothetical protein
MIIKLKKIPILMKSSLKINRRLANLKCLKRTHILLQVDTYIRVTIEQTIIYKIGIKGNSGRESVV